MRGIWEKRGAAVKEATAEKSVLQQPLHMPVPEGCCALRSNRASPCDWMLRFGQFCFANIGRYGSAYLDASTKGGSRTRWASLGGRF